MKTPRSRRRRSRPARPSGTLGALARALLLAGPLAIAVVLAAGPRADRSERLVAANGPDGLDAMTTGSVSGSRFTFAVGAPTVPPSFAGCLRFPDGSQRGAC